MNLKAVPFLLVVLFAPIKLYFLYHSSTKPEFILWVVGISGVCIWPTWAYWKDRDMPARSGDFQFRADGKNSVTRSIYVCFLLVCFAGFLIFA